VDTLKRVGMKFRSIVSTDSKLGYFIRKVAEKFMHKPFINGIKELSDCIGLPVSALKPWINGIPDGYGYESFQIPKKNGRGRRKIDAPNHELKILQRTIYRALLQQGNLHQAATAYIPNRSIFNNALPHVGQKVVINIDLKNFFGSISSERIYQYWNHFGWDVDASIVLRNICCFNGSLPQGAPTSPALSNLCNHLLDIRLEAATRKLKGQYTRYSDDLTFSFPNASGHQRGILKTIHQILAEEGYEIQEKKRIRVQRSHQRQSTTGLIVNEKINLPREVRKRIRAMRHHHLSGKLSNKDTRRLKGYESLLKMIEKVNGSTGSKLTASSTPDHVGSLSPKRILLLASNPVDKSRLRIDREAYEIAEGLKRSMNREQFKLEQRWATGTDDLRRALLGIKPKIVHFSGHGSDDGIIVEDDNGNSKTVSTEALVRLFALCAEHIECVLLNSCDSETLATAMSQHISYVIGMSQAIGDRAALKFSKGFYDALGAGESIEMAYKYGRSAIELDNIPEHLTPQLKKKS
jgi:retron-type reverse transcriptase